MLVVADVHANLAAFEAVIADAATRVPIDAIWSLGDILGYGPEPRACLALLQSYSHLAVAGNHDLAAAGLISTGDFNAAAASAAAWTAAQLTATDRAYVAALPQTIVEDDFTLVHGALWNPIWGYLISNEGAHLHLKHQASPYCFVGHSHLPLVFTDASGDVLDDGGELALDDGRWVANPGGVGQPRDGDPRAAYALLDRAEQRVRFHRVAYDIGRTQAKMRAASLPASLIQRLQHGR